MHIIRTKYRIKQTGEVFTPLPLVDEILTNLFKHNPTLIQDPTKTFLDPACGDGNILARVLEWKIANGSDPIQALRTVYGVELMPDNAKVCRKRLINIVLSYIIPEYSSLQIQLRQKLKRIARNNIACSNALEWNFETWEPKKQDTSKKDSPKKRR
jgi:hypothetical protein